MGTIVAALLPLVPGMVNFVEGLFSKPKSGPDKMSAVVAALNAILQQLIASKTDVGGAAIAALPDPSALVGMVETVLADLKASGQLGKPTASGALYLVQGSVTPLRGT